MKRGALRGSLFACERYKVTAEHKFFRSIAPSIATPHTMHYLGEDNGDRPEF